MSKGPIVHHPGIVMLVMILSMAIIAGMVHSPGGSITGEVAVRSQCSDRMDNDKDGYCDFGTQGYKCRDGSKRGDRECTGRLDNREAPDVVVEQVKCIFKGSTTKQSCYSSKGSCEGVDTCGVEVRGVMGEQVTWKSSCGDYAYTKMDGQSEYAEFSCAPVCGNSQCESGESCSSCSSDCGVCAPLCGNGKCEANESCSSCSLDCGACAPLCGNRICEFSESCSSCSVDCGPCPLICGNGKCEGNETCSTCSNDCGSCPPVCGNGKCESNETCKTCSADCGTCNTCVDSDGENIYVKGVVTYNGYHYTDACSSESSVNEQICRLWSDGSYVLGNKVFSCPYGCQSGACLSSSPVYCGNGKCDTNETCSSCSADCGICPTNSTNSTSFCQDKDEKDPNRLFVTSSCLDAQGEHYDYCESSTTLRDWYCTGTWDGTSWSNRHCAPGGYVCPNGCSSGACVTPICGNSKCEWGESCSSCTADCGLCPSNSTNSTNSTNLAGSAVRSKCGNGRCDRGETCSACSKDCGICPPVCGNGRCESGESCSSCSFDCGVCQNSSNLTNMGGMAVHQSRYYYR